jgi:hypothetical protein
VNTRRILSLALLTGVLAIGGTACSDEATSTDTTAATNGNSQVVGPVMADITTVDGTTVEVSLGRVLVISADDPAAWSATIADQSVLSFQAGTVDGDASFNPGFTPLKAGSTEVTMTDGTTTMTFTVTVTS